MEGKRTIIRDVLTVTMDANSTLARMTIVMKDGLFESVSPTSVALHQGNVEIDGRRFVALPGMLNGHVHGDVVAARGLGDGLTLDEQNDNSLVGRKRWFRNELHGRMRKLSRLLQMIECVKSGCTWVCDVPFWPPEDDDWADPFRAVGIGGAIVVDYRKDFLTGERMDRDEIARTMREIGDAGLTRVIGAPPEEGFDERELLHVRDVAEKEDALIHMHLSETVYRMSLIRDRFNQTPVEYLDSIGFLSPRLVASHGVQMNAEDSCRFREAGCAMINTPVAEMKIADGVAPVPDWINSGLPLGIGTDGALWNDSSDLFGEMKTMLLLHRVHRGADALSPKSVLELATRSGARAYGLDSERGSIERGKRADLVLLNKLTPHAVPWSNVYSTLVSCVKSSDVHTVFRDGKAVVQQGQVVNVSEEDVVEQMQSYGEVLHREIRDK